MTSDERELKRLVGQRLPSHMEFVAARDRVLNELSAAPPHLQKARLTDSPPALSERQRVEGLRRARDERRAADGYCDNKR